VASFGVAVWPRAMSGRTNAAGGVDTDLRRGELGIGIDSFGVDGGKCVGIFSIREDCVGITCDLGIGRLLKSKVSK
jgi:hypothetical protein